jgi:hypothetical protein
VQLALGKPSTAKAGESWPIIREAERASG